MAAVLITPFAAQAQGTLRVGMTASDIPLTTGQTDQGGEGMRFIGYTLYDALINWDLTSADRPSALIPGLATEWSVDEADKTKWTFKIREGVKFHDGSELDAEAIVWNLDKLLDEVEPAIRPAPVRAGQVAHSRGRVLFRAGQIHARDHHDDARRHPALPAGLDPDVLAGQLGGARPGLGRGRAGAVRNRPLDARELRAARAGGDGAVRRLLGRDSRVPKLDKMVLIPLPEPNARSAALLSGQVDWIEAPAPDVIPALEGNGFEIVSNTLPHNWTWHLSRLEGSPWNDINVRKAANLAIDREGMKHAAGRADGSRRRLPAARIAMVRRARVQGDLRSARRRRRFWRNPASVRTTRSRSRR